MINPCNNTLLNVRAKVFGPAKGLPFLVQALFTGYMLRFDGGTVQDQLDPATYDKNEYDRALFGQALKALPVEYPTLLKIWQEVYPA